MARRTGSVDEFEFKAIEDHNNQGWESKNLIAVSTAIQDWLTSRIATELMRQGAMMTVLGSLLTALAWPAALLAATDFIDSTWTIAVNRTDKAGKLLAEVLLKGYQAELVERVVLLGAPISIKGENWEAARKMVAGRFINAYSTNDWMLGVAFRASLLTQGLAGIQPVGVQGIENLLVNRKSTTADTASAPAHVHSREDPEIRKPQTQKPTHAEGDDFLSRQAMI
ncbi:hypothetical protein COLO4_21965 [Corchorus olitorius]|uniref:Uncharacterized protein n=1 Tax=Corchorus olitorius TaxID=93759 RepID=A0A1R3IPR5_9ROSI|nr:hypothetical protein COLO4_21965 [Corchorus olitorius]